MRGRRKRDNSTARTGANQAPADRGPRPRRRPILARQDATVLAAPTRGGFDNVAWIAPIAVFLLATLAAGLSTIEVVAASEKPNLVWIMADDLGYGDLGCYGQTVIQTPHLDRMAREGLRFTQFYAGATVCAPSRSVLMT